jgi:hypothetical protein
MKYTKESETLQSFVNSNLQHIPIERLNKPSQNELLRIYRHMRDANNKYKNIKFYQNDNVPGADISYIPEDIKPHISRCTHTHSIMFKISHRIIRFSIFAPVRIPNFMQYIKRVYMLLYIATQYARIHCSNTININLYLTEHVKVLPPIGQVIGRANVNTAFTTPCSDSTNICIFREQEWFKVLLHESFHNLGLDFSDMKNTTADTQIAKMFKINSDIRLYEAYCETWAEIIHSQFITFFSTRIKDRFDIMMGKLDHILEVETRFSLFQCVKVLNHNNMVYTDLFNESKRRQYREDTHILSYYIIKALLLYNKNRFIGWCSTYNEVLLDFNKSTQGIDEFCALIRSLYMDPIYISLLQTIEPWFIYNKMSNTLPRKTLRMTVFELEN